MTINSIFLADQNPGAKFSHSDHEVGAVCIPNISKAEREKRISFGIRQLIFTMVILAVLIVLGVNHYWRLPLLFLFWAAGTGFFQAFDKT